jgi:hypothetical protein
MVHKKDTKEALADEKWEIEKQLTAVNSKIVELQDQQRNLTEWLKSVETAYASAPWENPQAVDYQFYSYRGCRLVHAGVEKLTTITPEIVVEREKRWRAWRKQFLQDHPDVKEEDYTVDQVLVFPVDDLTKRQVFNMPKGLDGSIV